MSAPKVGNTFQYKRNTISQSKKPVSITGTTVHSLSKSQPSDAKREKDRRNKRMHQERHFLSMYVSIIMTWQDPIQSAPYNSTHLCSRKMKTN